jgi:hypothetical protein
VLLLVQTSYFGNTTAQTFGLRLLEIGGAVDVYEVIAI